MFSVVFLDNVSSKVVCVTSPYLKIAQAMTSAKIRLARGKVVECYAYVVPGEIGYADFNHRVKFLPAKDFHDSAYYKVCRLAEGEDHPGVPVDENTQTYHFQLNALPPKEENRVMEFFA